MGEPRTRQRYLQHTVAVILPLDYVEACWALLGIVLGLQQLRRGRSMLDRWAGGATTLSV